MGNFQSLSHSKWECIYHITWMPKYDELVKNQKAPAIVIPVKTGIHENQLLMDPLFRGSDGLGNFLRDHQI